MARLRAFEAAHPSRPGPVCGGCKLPRELRGFLIKGRAAGTTYRNLAAFVTLEGHKLSPYMVAYHLRHAEG